MTKKRVLLSPLDPVHDIGLKMIKNALDEAGHDTYLLPPDVTPGEIVEEALEKEAEVILLSRTLGYGVAELLGRFVDLVEGAGIRHRVKIGIGGMAIKPAIAAELGFDQGFGPKTPVEEAVAFVEGKTYTPPREGSAKRKGDLVRERTYEYHHQEIKSLLEEISEKTLQWYEKIQSPGIKRAELREKGLAGEKEYLEISDDSIKDFFSDGILPSGLRLIDGEEQKALESIISAGRVDNPRILQRQPHQPLVFIQYGTGCPFMDIAHVKGTEGWGADGVVHFDPSWGAKTEGLLSGLLSHEENGSVITDENLKLIKKALESSTLWQVRAHRGLNTPETVLLAGEAGAELTKINPVYGSLGGGTDPERLLADSIKAMEYAARYKMPFDMPTNEELCGVPAYKAFAGMLIVTQLGLALGAQPVLQPLFCYSPEMMLGGQMEDNYIDYNAAKVMALRGIIDAPIWAGAPIGFLTHTEERVQSSVSTSFHAGMAASLEIEGISIASADEAYSGGPITLPARIDTLQGTGEAFRFLGSARMQPTPKAEEWAEELTENILKVLKEVVKNGSFLDSLYQGILGSQKEGAYPGRNGRGTVLKRK